jgi:hypothetical protein
MKTGYQFTRFARLDFKKKMEQESVCVSEGFAGKANPKLGVKLI